jgi:hypothetical protein
MAYTSSVKKGLVGAVETEALGSREVRAACAMALCKKSARLPRTSVLHLLTHRIGLETFFVRNFFIEQMIGMTLLPAASV